MRKPIVFAMTIAAIASLTVFQNCAPTQNFDLAQQSSLSGAGDESTAVPVPTPTPSPEVVEPTPTPTPAPTPIPTPEISASGGTYCPADRQPQVQAKVFDLGNAGLNGSASWQGIRSSAKELTDLKIFLKAINIPKMPVADILRVGGQAIQVIGGAELRQNYMIEMESYLQLPSGARSMDYQVVAKFSGHLQVEIFNSQTKSMTEVINKKSDANGMFEICGGVIPLKVTDQPQIRVRHVHGTNPDARLQLYLRPAEGDLANCGAGLTELRDSNFVLEPDEANLIVNAGFEDGSSQADGSVYALGSLNGWQSARGFERWTTKANGQNSVEGRHFVELDKDAGGSADEISQVLTSKIEIGQRYRFVSEHALRPEQGTRETNEVIVRFGNRAGGSYARSDLAVVTGPGNKQWAGYAFVVTPTANDIEISFAEPGNRNDSVGGLIDSVHFKKIKDFRHLCP